MSFEQTYRGISVAESPEKNRGRFISRTYGHLFGAVCAFILLEMFYFRTGLAERITSAVMGVSWLLVLGGFVVVSWVATRTAHRATSKGVQYASLGVYVLAESLIFVPILFIADRFAPGVISSAAAITFLGFTALTAVVLLTGKDFSFLRGILFWGGIVSMVLIVGGVIFGFNLGTYFSVGMVALAGASILYDTSKILLYYPEDRYVAGALELFASVALMLWYVLRLFMSGRR